MAVIVAAVIVAAAVADIAEAAIPVAVAVVDTVEAVTPVEAAVAEPVTPVAVPAVAVDANTMKVADFQRLFLSLFVFILNSLRTVLIHRTSGWFGR